jgi:hypothetical protein
MSGAIALLILAGLFGLGILWLAIDASCRQYVALRERRDMRIRNEQLKRYCITPMFGTKERHR